MIPHTKSYGRYKKSSIPFLQQIPEHWDECALWPMCKVRNERNPGSQPLLSVFLHQGVILHNNSNRQTHAPSLDLSNYQKVCPGDLVLNNQQAWRGSVGVSFYTGIISPAYIVLGLSRVIDSKYANYLFQSRPLVGQYVISSKGVGDIQRQLYWPYLRNVRIPLPPLDEQFAIVRYLDHMDRLIKRYIRAKQKQIKLLNEQKQAIIHQAVTRGLNPDVRLKPSGVEWLGNIPESNRVVPLRYLGTKFGSGMTPRGGSTTYLKSGIPLIRSQNVRFEGLDIENVVYISYETHEKMGGTHITLGDVLLNITGASIGRVCVVPQNLGEANVNQHVSIIRPKKELITSEYLAIFLSSPYIQREIARIANGAAREGLPQKDMKALLILLPPLREQNEIASEVQKRVRKIDDLANSIWNHIDLINEYRTRLVADVVTGKLDVREAALGLPEEFGTPEAEEEIQEEEDLEQPEVELGEE